MAKKPDRDKQLTLEAHILRELVASPTEVAINWLNQLDVQTNGTKQYLGTYVDERTSKDVSVFFTTKGKFDLVYGKS